MSRRLDEWLPTLGAPAWSLGKTPPPRRQLQMRAGRRMKHEIACALGKNVTAVFIDPGLVRGVVAAAELLNRCGVAVSHHRRVGDSLTECYPPSCRPRAKRKSDADA